MSLSKWAIMLYLRRVTDELRADKAWIQRGGRVEAERKKGGSAANLATKSSNCPLCFGLRWDRKLHPRQPSIWLFAHRRTRIRSSQSSSKPAVDLAVLPPATYSPDVGRAANYATSGNCSVSSTPGLDRGIHSFIFVNWGIQSCLHGVVNVQPYSGSSPFSLHCS
jgi:hypothetical protein